MGFIAIRKRKGLQNPSFTPELEALLKNRMVVTCEPVFAELLFGARNDKAKKKILGYWNVMPRMEFESGSLLVATDFANRSNDHNPGIGLVDAAIVCPVIQGQYKIWTLDSRLIKSIDKQYLYRKGELLFLLSCGMLLSASWFLNIPSNQRIIK